MLQVALGKITEVPHPQNDANSVRSGVDTLHLQASNLSPRNFTNRC
ncbi:MAG: hypothetical protein HC920_07125 [Oscillatoriales cyanobacterium SM2_3_0]|nr:hypothetical protein [Oscillatoriales cyanobacterium SM2_3_0]